ncbi:AN1-like Zinc finger containing protein, putative [Trypanosoma equiperdum]|uniref:AN1-like Zinc finger containing protein, putative n=1 Tax=Trypanosoma equiperdum TaxID=5694 RepID=A0A1G4I1T6_TRYEQ|nr:AN1-like Zinc finger containing protein, putative [Trypanosoma equiperdum]
MSVVCAFKGCSNLTYTALPACEHCSQRMCTSHLLPEVHGCGDRAKNVAQRKATADAAEQRQQRKHIGLDDAKARLTRRREELAAQRQKKPIKKK